VGARNTARPGWSLPAAARGGDWPGRPAGLPDTRTKNRCDTPELEQGWMSETEELNTAPDALQSDEPSLGDASGWIMPPDGVRIWLDDLHRLCVSAGDETFEGVRPRYAFPLSSKCDYISFLGEEGKEVLLLSHPRKLDGESRQALRTALERTYYTAKILQVYDIKEAMGVAQWRVRTNRGFATFEIVDRNQHIRSLPSERYLLMDADGNRFEIEDLSRLDAHSQAEVHHET